jgi:hypothetical protein
MIKNILIRRKESDIYLHQLMKATVLAESYNISSFFIVIYELQQCLLTVAR